MCCIHSMLLNCTHQLFIRLFHLLFMSQTHLSFICQTYPSSMCCIHSLFILRTYSPFIHCTYPLSMHWNNLPFIRCTNTLIIRFICLSFIIHTSYSPIIHKSHWFSVHDSAIKLRVCLIRFSFRYLSSVKYPSKSAMIQRVCKQKYKRPIVDSHIWPFAFEFNSLNPYFYESIFLKSSAFNVLKVYTFGRCYHLLPLAGIEMG